ncbi:MAG TPA: glycoside hydrolase domain-containing protein [Planctomycetota bacterium]|nr:glycoside hydrolase domain-containing protein [Planctomycetota bacterium]
MTPFNSWVSFDVRPEVIQAWVDDPAKNQGLVLRQVQKTDPPGKKSTGGFVVFASNTDAMTHLRPKLTLTYEASGNVAPFAPVLTQRFDGITAGAEHVVRWTTPDPPDLNRNLARFELEVARADGPWKTVTDAVAPDAREFTWNTADLPVGEGYRLRIRAVDDAGADSDWVASDGTFTVARRTVPFQVGIATPIEKIRRDKPYEGKLSNEASIALARNEYEGFQVVVAGVARDVKDLRAATGDLTSPAGVIAAKHVTVNPVGYVNTIVPSYRPEWVGQWPDVLLNVDTVDVPAGKVQPIWVTVYAPPGTPAGTYTGKLTLSAADVTPQEVKLTVRVFDFDLPVRPTLQAFALGNIAGPKFYGMERDDPKYDDVRRMWYDFLCRHRLSPGGMVLKAWSWDKPVWPVKVNADGSYDFSEAAKWGEYCFARGMNAFVAAAFTKPGKWGFPKTYSEKYYSDYTKFMKAYTAFLKGKGWLTDAVVYNIDEAPPEHWEMCKENFRKTRAVSPDLQVFQCLNNPKGVAALDGFFDVVDVNIGQFHAGAAPQLLKENKRVWWCVCCWPSSHPNLFVDYPAMDARIIGWLSWKLGVEGFEYWSVSSWSNCLKTMEGKTFVDEIDSRWNANSFGKYNGDGYLTYPGPNGTLLSSIRFEALRDGFEDHEYLAELKRRLAGKTGAAADAARKLLEVDDAVCRRDLGFTSDPRVLLDARRRVAEAIEKLPPAMERRAGH